MLQKLRDRTQSFGFKIVVAVLVFALAFFGFGAFNIFAPGDPTIASVNGEDITQGALLEEADRQRRRLMAELGDEPESDSLDPLAIQNQALEGLITRRLLAQIVEDMDLAASSARVDAAVLADPGFQVDGKFNQDFYRRALSALGYTPTGYLADLASRLSVNQLRLALFDTALATEWESGQFVRLADQQRDLAWLSFTVAHFSGRVAVEEADIELHYIEHEAEMMTEEKVDVAYVELHWEQLQDDPSIDIGEAELQREHEADKAAAADRERRRSSHILLRTGDERSEEEAVSQLQGLRERLLAGEPFAELAESHSEDPGSAAVGGDLGFVGRGIFDPAFEEALWQLQEGETSPPVKSAFGYHLIRLDGVETEEFPDFAVRKDELEQRLRQRKARELFEDLVRELDNLAFEDNESLAGIEEAFGLEQRMQEGVTRGGGEGLFAAAELREAVFAPDVLGDGNNTAAIEHGDGRAFVARVVNHQAPQLKPFEEARPQIEALLVRQAARQALTEAHESALARVKAGDSTAAVAEDYGLAWRTLERVRRADDRAPPAVLEAAFSLPRPPTDGKSVGVAALGEEGEAIVTVTRVVEGDSSALADAELDSLRQLLLARNQQLDFEALYQGYLADADISRRTSLAD